MSFFLDEDEVKVAEELYTPKGGDHSGERVVEIGYVYISKSKSSNAEALVIEYKHEDGFRGTERYWVINKETGTPKTPEGKPTFGSLQAEEFFGSMKVNPRESKPVPTTIKVFGEEKSVPVFRDFFGKKVRVVIQKKEEESYTDGSIIEVDEVLGWFDLSTRKNRRELSIENSEPLQIEKDIKRSEKLRKLKVKKEKDTTPKEQTAEDAFGW